MQVDPVPQPAVAKPPLSLSSFLAQYEKRQGTPKKLDALPPSSATNDATLQIRKLEVDPDKERVIESMRQQMLLRRRGTKRPLFAAEPSQEVSSPEAAPEEEEEDKDATPETTLDEELLLQQMEELVPLGATEVQQLVFEADQLHFGNEVLAPVTMYVQVAPHAQRYSLQEQVGDLLDQLLSDIPKYKRTHATVNDVHAMVQRFVQLRHEVSVLDNNHNVSGFRASAEKPLTAYLRSFSHALAWIVPVVYCERKLQLFALGSRRRFDQGEQDTEEETEEQRDYTLSRSVEQARAQLRELAATQLHTMASGAVGGDINKYKDYCVQLQQLLMPFLPEADQSPQFLQLLSMERDVDALSNNFDAFLSTMCSHGQLESIPFGGTKYTTSLTMCDASGKRVRVAANEALPLKSIITLPGPVVRYSRIQLPGTSLLQRAQLNSVGGFFLSQLLRGQHHRITEVQIDDLNIDIDFGSAEQYLNNIKNYGLTTTRALSEEEFQRFTDAIVPNTDSLVKMLEPDLQSPLSLLAAIRQLEPFLLYSHNVSAATRNLLVKLVDQNLRQYRRALERNRKVFHALRQLPSAPLMVANAYTVLNNLITPAGFDKVVCQKYDLHSCREEKAIRKYSNLEYLVRMLHKDNMRLYTDAVSLLNFHLTYAKEFHALLETDSAATEKAYQESAAANDAECGPIIIAKWYKSEAELRADDKRDAYFDKKYDRTDYSQLDLYEDAIAALDADELLEYLTTDLQEKHPGFTEEDAAYLANTLLDGHKKVKNGHYAILHKGYKKLAKDETELYIRQNDQWVLDTEHGVGEDKIAAAIADDADILCYLREKCMALQEQLQTTDGGGGADCSTAQEQNLGLRTALLREIINEFDQKFNLTSEQSEQLAKEHFQYDAETLDQLEDIHARKLLKYNQLHYLLGFQLQQQTLAGPGEEVREESPYRELLDNILEQEDVEMQMRNVLKFAERFCLEHGAWYICNKTRANLLPTFRVQLAQVFICHNEELFQERLETIKKEQGAVVDDYWVDKKTGWRICPVEEAAWECLDEEGHKVAFRAVLPGAYGGAKDAAELEVPTDGVRSFTALSSGRDLVQVQMITRVMQGLCTALGIRLSNQLDFVVDVVSQYMSEHLPTEEDYNRLAAAALAKEKSKKPVPYETQVHAMYMYAILAALVYAIQTSIPSVRAKRRFEGCPQLYSFSGYPLGKESDLSCIKYVVCVAQHTAGKEPPANALPGKKRFDHVVQQVHQCIQRMAMFDTVQHKREQKTLQLYEHLETEVTADHILEKFVHFLPPLVRFQVAPSLAQRPGEAFFESLADQLRTANPAQRASIAVLQSKLIASSLAIVQSVDAIVAQEHLLLDAPDSQRPLLENACCQTTADTRSNALSYFEKKNREVTVHNQVARYLTKKLWDTYYWYRVDTVQCDRNSKSVYPAVPDEFTQQTVLLVFIHYCKFLSVLPIPSYLAPYCPRKPEDKEKEAWRSETKSSLVTSMMSQERAIKEYTPEAMQVLLQKVSEQHVIPPTRQERIEQVLTAPLNKLQDLLERSSVHFDPPFKTVLLRALEATTDDNKAPLKELMNHVMGKMQAMQRELKEHLSWCEKKNSRVLQDLAHLDKWSILQESAADKDYFTAIQFLKNAIKNVCAVYPAILLHGAVKQYSDQGRKQFPHEHVRKLNDALAHARRPLEPFLQDPLLSKLLVQVQINCKEISILAETVPCVRQSSHWMRPAHTKLFLEYLLLSALDQYLQLAKDKTMVYRKQTCAQGPQQQQQPAEDGESDSDEEPCEDAETERVLQRVERETKSLIAVDQQRLKEAVCKLLAAYVQMVFREKTTLDQTHATILEMNFKLRQKETDRFVDTVKRMNEEERRTYRQLKTLGLTSIGYSAKETNRYQAKRYLEEAEMREEQAAAELGLLELRREQAEDDVAEENNVSSMVVTDTDTAGPCAVDLQEWNLPYEEDD